MPIFGRIDITNSDELESFSKLNHPNKTAVLFLPTIDARPDRVDDDRMNDIVNRHYEALRLLQAASVTQFAIGADNDGVLHSLYSSRNSQRSLTERAAPLLRLYDKVKLSCPDLSVFLTVEDLSPGGLDATDGIAIAKELEDRGLKTIVACAGSKDFPPLFNRRATNKKQPEALDFRSNEPSLASALWLKQHTSLNVLCYAFIDDVLAAKTVAKQLGLCGLIQKAQIASI